MRHIRVLVLITIRNGLAIDLSIWQFVIKRVIVERKKRSNVFPKSTKQQISLNQLANLLRRIKVPNARS